MNKERRSVGITVRVNEQQKRAADRLAKRAQMSLSDWFLAPRGKEIAKEL